MSRTLTLFSYQERKCSTFRFLDIGCPISVNKLFLRRNLLHEHFHKYKMRSLILHINSFCALLSKNMQKIQHFIACFQSCTSPVGCGDKCYYSSQKYCISIYNSRGNKPRWTYSQSHTTGSLSSLSAKMKGMAHLCWHLSTTVCRFTT